MKHVFYIGCLVFIFHVTIGLTQTACKNITCPNDIHGNPQCCSSELYCGIGEGYCDAGCVSGPCDPSPIFSYDLSPKLNPREVDMCNGTCDEVLECCSRHKYCGSTAAHCEYGCTSGLNCSHTPPSIGPTADPKGECNDSCPSPDLCCSRFHFCGATEDHCKSGCTYGARCNFTKPDVPPPAAAATGECVNGTSCPDMNLCCSFAGFCGNTTEHCAFGCTYGKNCNFSISSEDGMCRADNTCPNPAHCCSEYNYCNPDPKYCGEGCKGGPCRNVTREVAVDIAVFSILGVVVAIGAVFAIATAVLLIVKRSYFARHGPFYSSVIIFGALMGYAAAVLPLIPVQTKPLCLAFGWLAGLAFTIVYGCLFIKTWVMYDVFRKAAQMKRVFLHPYYILKLLAIFCSFEIILLIIISLVGNMNVYQLKVGDGPEYEYQCRSSSVFWIIFFTVKILWVAFGTVMSVLMRKMPQEYHKSLPIAFSIYNNIIVLILAGLLGLRLQPVAFGLRIIMVIAVVAIFTFTLVALNIDTWYKIFYAKFDIVDQMMKVRGAAQTRPLAHGERVSSFCESPTSDTRATTPSTSQASFLNL